MIVAISAGVIGWMFAKKSQGPVQKEVATQPVVSVQQVQPEVQTIAPAPQQVTQPTQKDSILDEKMKNEIMDWSNYKSFENIKWPVLGIEECSNDKSRVAYELFMKNANRDIKKFEFAKFGTYGIDFYITPNYNKVQKFESGCSGGLGAIYPIATYKDNILWGYLACSGGASPGSDSPVYNDFSKCEKMADELSSYLGLN